jgi:hypothetical protein
LIDTRIWVLALRAPVAEPGSRLAELGERARKLVLRLREEGTLLFTPQLVAEIRHVLTSRGANRLPSSAARDCLLELLAARRSRLRTLSRRGLTRALNLSAESGIAGIEHDGNRHDRAEAPPEEPALGEDCRLHCYGHFDAA